MVAATRSRRLFGVGSGGLIALESALILPGVTHVAAYQPSVHLPHEKHIFEQFDDEVAAGKRAEALVTVLKGVSLGPLWLRVLPRPLLTAVLRKLIQEDEEELTGLLPTVRHDYRSSVSSTRTPSRAPWSPMARSFRSPPRPNYAEPTTTARSEARTSSLRS